jgi:hypothetical protein
LRGVSAEQPHHCAVTKTLGQFKLHGTELTVFSPYVEANVHRHVDNSPQERPVLSQMSPINTLSHFNYDT